MPAKPAAPTTPPLIAALRRRFAAHANPAEAGPMQAYMKSALPCYGIAAPLRRTLMAEAVREHPAPNTEALTAAMRMLWSGATFREERYAAMELARVGPHKKLLTLALLPLYEEMIVTSAWWDCCDDISGTALTALLQRHPAKLKPVLRRWARGDDLWLRRAAMLCQRRLKDADGFDAKLLYDCIEPSLDDPRFKDQFFIRKGIGWALRERSYAAPDEVRAYCRANAARLSPLSRREALKALARREAHEASDAPEASGASGA
jgi:3-methyladenine DNA glycosylase AlkD